MTGQSVVVIPNAVRDLYIAIPAYLALCEQSPQSQFIGMYAASVSDRSQTLRQTYGNDRPGMTARRVVVIPNAVRDLYTAIPAYIDTNFHLNHIQNK